MFDSICFRDPHPEIVPGSTIDKVGQPRTDDAHALLTKGADGSQIKLRTGGLLHGDHVVAIRARSSGLYIETSLARDPRAPRGPNVFCVSNAEECRVRMELIGEHLRELGIHTDLDTTRLSKVHVCTDVLPDLPYEEYQVALQACGLQLLCQAQLSRCRAFGEKIPQQSQLPLQEHTYGRTWSYRATVIYSKLPQLMREKSCREYADAVQRSIDGRPVLRFESRLNKAASVKRHLGITAGKHLYERWDMVAEKRLTLIDKAIGSDHHPGGATAQECVGPPGSLSLAKSIVEAKGKGVTAALLDFAVEGLAARLERGHDVEADRARLYAAGIRPSSIDEALDLLMQFTNETDTTRDALRRDLHHRLRTGRFEWPELG